MADIRELQLIQLELLKTIKDICEKEQLTYYIVCGTLLGAVRHKGYIPWDDDTDVAMPRPDYEKFIKVANKYLRDGQRLKEFNSSSDYNHFPARLESRKGKLRVLSGRTEYEQDVCVDIFVLDGLPNNRVKRYMHERWILLLRGLYLFSVFDYVFVYRPNRTIFERIGVFIGNHLPIGRLFDPKKRLRAIDEALKKYSFNESRYIANIMGGYKLREIYPKEVYGKGKEYEFEDLRIIGPERYDEYLTHLYGDYMTFPPEAERNKHMTMPTETRGGLKLLRGCRIVCNKCRALFSKRTLALALGRESA